MSDYNNSIRIKGQFQRDHSAQSFKITRIPIVKGNIVNVPLDLCEMYRPIEIMLTNINKFDIGTAAVAYYNVCFNKMGFLTHGTAYMHVKQEIRLCPCTLLYTLKEETFAGRNFRGSEKPRNIYISRE